MTPRQKQLELKRIPANAPFAWAWMLEDGGLCYWAEPDKARLQSQGKPSPNAKAVCVRLIKHADFLELVRLARRATP